MRIVYATSVPFPNSSAGTNRMLGVGQALRRGGVEVVFAGGQSEEYKSEAGLASDVGSFEIGATGDVSESNSRALRGASTLWGGSKLVEWVGNRHERTPFDAIILYGGRLSTITRMRRWSRRTGVPLAVDSVEWYQADHMPLGRMGPFALDNEIMMRRGYASVGNVIAISEFLRQHYELLGANVIQVPPILAVGDLVPRPCPDDGLHDGKLRVVYAGTPGRKDLLDDIIGSVHEADPGGGRIELLVAGPSVDDLRGRGSRGGLDLSAVVPLGRRSPQDVRAMVREADFTILLRKTARYAQAGLSSKVPESLALGTPVIANVTPELGRFVRDYETGIVVPTPDRPALTAALRRAMLLSQEDRHRMRAMARAEAVHSFSVERYAGNLVEWVRKLKAPRS